MARPLSPHAFMILRALELEGPIVYTARGPKEESASADLYKRIERLCNDAKVPRPHRTNYSAMLRSLAVSGRIGVRTNREHRTYSIRLLALGKRTLDENRLNPGALAFGKGDVSV